MNKACASIIIFICLLFIAGTVCAQITDPLGAGSFSILFKRLADALSGIISALGAVMVIIAGILFLISAGQPGMIAKGKTALMFAVIGIAVGIGAGILADTIGGVTSSGFANDLMEVINSIADQVGTLMAGLGAVMFSIAGIFFLLSFGNPQKMEMAKKALFYSVLGVVIGLTAKIIVATVVGWVS